MRLLDFDLLKDDAARRRAFRERIFSNLPADAKIPDTFPKVIRIMWIFYPIWIDPEKPRIWPAPEKVRRMPMRDA